MLCYDTVVNDKHKVQTYVNHNFWRTRTKKSNGQRNLCHINGAHFVWQGGGLWHSHQISGGEHLFRFRRFSCNFKRCKPSRKNCLMQPLLPLAKLLGRHKEMTVMCSVLPCTALLKKDRRQRRRCVLVAHTMGARNTSDEYQLFTCCKHSGNDFLRNNEKCGWTATTKEALRKHMAAHNLDHRL